MEEKILTKQKITWQRRDLNEQVFKDLYYWRDEDLDVYPEDASIENMLSWPLKTIAVLRKAAEKKLSRYTCWNLDRLTNQAAHLLAAGVYLRGVRIDSSIKVTNSFSLQEVRSCTIKLLDPELNFFEQIDLSTSFLVVDESVLKAWKGFPSKNICVLKNVSEASKELNLVKKIVESWRACGSSKHWYIVGGGISLDVAAFAASQSCVSFSCVPTTLLAMVDASIGGKTAVNLNSFGKNILGTFSFPEEVLVWPPWLASLNKKEFISGGGECLKHALLSGDMFFLQNLSSIFSSGSIKNLYIFLDRLLKIKISFVQEDLYELKGLRKVLNLGHTLAHALEAYALYNIEVNQELSHGEAVSFGLLFSVFLSKELGFLSESNFKKIEVALLSSNCIPVLSFLDLENIESSWPFLYNYITRDKKNYSAKKSEWILLASLGEIVGSSSGYSYKLEEEVLKKQWIGFLKKYSNVVLSSS